MCHGALSSCMGYARVTVLTTASNARGTLLQTDVGSRPMYGLLARGWWLHCVGVEVIRSGGGRCSTWGGNAECFMAHNACFMARGCIKTSGRGHQSRFSSSSTLEGAHNALVINAVAGSVGGLEQGSKAGGCVCQLESVTTHALPQGWSRATPWAPTLSDHPTKCTPRHLLAPALQAGASWARGRAQLMA